MKKAYDLHIGGIVQGVGFRPFIYRQAVRWHLDGWVLNASDGVHVHIEGDAAALEGFINELAKQAPSAALITSVAAEETPLENISGFSIRASQELSQADTLVSPDIATCPLCLQELFDQKDRRFHYPFINCTNCGPRFTIIDSLPYDRPNTSMAGFEMCAVCGSEYHDPANRRFHAQPDACFNCGPSLQLWRSVTDKTVAHDRKTSDSLIEEVASMIDRGQIVAIKGLGGYHLACDAANEQAVETLRKRKRRTAKPFALMVRDLRIARSLCRVSNLEASILTGTMRPIVLLERTTGANAEATAGATAGANAGAATEARADARAEAGHGRSNASIAPSVAGSLHELGIMLPSTPLQHLLMAAVDRPLVMTSGNISEEPIISAEQEAHELLGTIADAFLDNNREILSRYDDSVLRIISERVFMVRRARGYAPRPLPFPQLSKKPDEDQSSPGGILATGPEQKNSFCITREKQAFVSQHLGDLQNAMSFAAWLSTLRLYERLFDLEYQAVACDMHPEYLSTKWARAQGEFRVEVQHHHAHIASVLAEQQALGDASDAGDIRLIDQVIGIAFDGTGYGVDDSIWGGEVLIAGLAGFRRFAHLRCVPLAGGQAAITHPDRMAWSYLKSLGLTQHKGAAFLAGRIGKDRLLLLDQIITGRVNSPLTSSMGRLFDAISALIGVCAENSYEGQAAVELEAALYNPKTAEPVDDPQQTAGGGRYHFEIKEPGIKSTGDTERAPTGLSIVSSVPETSSLEFDPTPVFAAVLDDLLNCVSPQVISRRFHEAVVELIGELCDEARRQTGLSTVALSGGVFMNRYIVTKAIPLLESEGFTVLLNRELPANDGCISYGQAAVATAQLAQLADRYLV